MDKAFDVTEENFDCNVLCTKDTHSSLILDKGQLTLYKKDITNMAQCTTAGSGTQGILYRRDSTSLDLDKAFDVTDVMCIVHCTKEGTLKFTFK